MSTQGQLAAFIARQRQLLAKERDEEINRSSLLLSNCGSKLLEKKGLALLGLGIVDVKIGLGGKTCGNSGASSFELEADALQVQISRVRTANGTPFNSNTLSTYFPVWPRSCPSEAGKSYVVRPGDLARIDENTSSSSKKYPKGKKNERDSKDMRTSEGVVYKVRLILTVQNISIQHTPDFGHPPSNCHRHARCRFG
jgi:DNA polymerase alpha-associated DNA helicase A